MGTVRPAFAPDIPQLIALGRAMHAESPALRHAPYNAGKVGANIETAMQIGLVLVHETDGVIDGGFVGIVVEYWFSTTKMLADLALYVHPGRRGSTAACRLLSAVLAWAKARALDVNISASTGIDPEQSGQFFEGMGFQRIGGVYQLRSA